MQLRGEFGLIVVRLEVIDVDVEAAAVAVGYGRDEFTVCCAEVAGGRVDEGFAIFGEFAGRWRVFSTDEVLGSDSAEDGRTVAVLDLISILLEGRRSRRGKGRPLLR